LAVPQVLEHLKNENAYTEAVFETPTAQLRKDLFEGINSASGCSDGTYRTHRSKFESEMKARIKEDDVEPASRKDDWFYYTRTETGSEYEIHCRRKVWSLPDPHQRQACA
jgi:oligopeptidase B